MLIVFPVVVPASLTLKSDRFVVLYSTHPVSSPETGCTTTRKKVLSRILLSPQRLWVRCRSCTQCAQKRCSNEPNRCTDTSDINCRRAGSKDNFGYSIKPGTTNPSTTMDGPTSATLSPPAFSLPPDATSPTDSTPQTRLPITVHPARDDYTCHFGST